MFALRRIGASWRRPRPRQRRRHRRCDHGTAAALSTVTATTTVTPRRIVVAMSGGVDSSVAAHMLARTYPHAALHAVYMHNWDAQDELGSGHDRACTSSEDWTMVQRVCARLGVRRVERVDFARTYWTRVFD